MSRRDRTLDVLAEVSGVAKDEIRPEIHLVADLEIDSPKALKLLVELEDALEIEISDEDAARMTTVRDVLDQIDSLAE